MKRIFQALLVLITLQTSNVFAQNVCAPRLTKVALLACRLELNLDIRYCTTAFKNVKPVKQRIASEISCISQGYKDFVSCLRQPASNTCTTSCQTAYTGGVNQCNATYDPVICGGDTGCEAVIIAEKANCIESENQKLNTCTAACAQ